MDHWPWSTAVRGMVARRGVEKNASRNKDSARRDLNVAMDQAGALGINSRQSGNQAGDQ